MKWLIIKITLKKTGPNFKFGYNSMFNDHRLIEIGSNVFMGQHTWINTNVPVVIGNDVMFGPKVTILGGDHNHSVVGEVMRNVKEGGKNIPVLIENDVWIGTNTTILKGVTIHEGCVVGAGSLVTKSLPPYSVCVGSPCRAIKLRFDEIELKKHLEIIKSKYSAEEVIKMFNSKFKSKSV